MIGDRAAAIFDELYSAGGEEWCKRFLMASGRVSIRQADSVPSVVRKFFHGDVSLAEPAKLCAIDARFRSDLSADWTYPTLYAVGFFGYHRGAFMQAMGLACGMIGEKTCIRLMENC